MTIINDFKNIIPKIDLIIFCTPMSEYEKIILKINKYLIPKTIITDVGSSKEKISLALIKKKLKKGISWTSSHPIAGSEVSGPEFGRSEFIFRNNGVF